jgi:APA family basic amino acid/polyamine antiporter
MARPYPSLVAITFTYQELYSFNMFAVWLFLALTAVALIRLRIKEPELPRPYHVWGYPWTPLLFGATACSIAVNLWLVRPIRSSIGLALIALGILFFNFWRRQALDSTISAKQGRQAETQKNRCVDRGRAVSDPVAPED